MNTLVKLVAFYFINLITFISIKVLFGSNITQLVESLKILMFPLFIVLIGLFFAYLTIVVQKPIEKREVFNYSLCIVSVITVLMIFGSQYLDWKHERDFGNIEANEDYFKYYVNQHKYEKKIAFDILSEKFSSRNDFRIAANLSYSKDSLLDGIPRTYFSMTYFYKLQSDKRFYKANFSIFDGKAKLLNYNEPMSLEDYSKLTRSRQKADVDFERTLLELPDSIKQRLQNVFP
jgi:hypothetical protein